MDMTATAEAARSWYENPRLGGSPNSTGLSSGASGHQSVSSGSTGLDGPDMGAFYALESSGHHRRYYSAGYHHSHSKCMSPFYCHLFLRRLLPASRVFPRFNILRNHYVLS